MKGKTILGVCLLLVLSATIVQAAVFTVLDDDGVLGVENANKVKADHEILVVADTSEGEISRINETNGSRMWSINTSGQHAMGIADNTTFIGSTIRWHNGTLKDTTPVGDSTDAEFDSNDEIYYVSGGNGGALYAIYEANGTAKWTTSGNYYSVEASDNWVWSIEGTITAGEGNRVNRHYKSNGTIAATYNIPIDSTFNDNEIKYSSGYIYAKLEQGDGDAFVNRYELSTTNSSIISNTSVQSTQRFSDKIATNDTYVFVQHLDGNNVSAYHHDNLSLAKTYASNGWGIHFYRFGFTPPTPTPIPEDEELKIEVNNWMAQNSTQKYNVIFENSSGRFDVTDSVTLVSNNTSVVSVNNSNTTIISHGVNNTTFVNTSYQGFNASENITVATRTLDNIGILPPGQWICGFLECDGGGGAFYVGSTTQWLIFIVIVASGFGRAFDNDWIGMGLGVLTAILLWVVGFVGIGMMLSVTFFGIFVGVMKVRVANNSGGETTVNINDTREFR